MTITGSVFNDTIIIEAGPSRRVHHGDLPGHQLDDRRRHLLRPAASRSTNPTDTLTIEGRGGGDTIIVRGLDADWTAELYLYGNKGGAPTIEPDVARDEVRFEANTFTNGAYLEVFADVIKILDGVFVSTLADNPADLAAIPTDDELANAGDIVFRARRIGTPEIENLMPAGYLAKQTEISVGAGARVWGSGIFLITQAEDRALATTLGLTTLGANFLLDPFISAITDLLTLPFKVLVKKSEAKVTIGVGAHVRGDYAVGIYATAVSDASGQAASQLISLGYSQAEAVAIIDIQAGAVIESRTGPVNITSDGTAIAGMSTETSREEQGAVPGRRGGQFAASLAISRATLTSRTTVAATASIRGARTVNVRALGAVESTAEAESSLLADGTASLGNCARVLRRRRARPHRRSGPGRHGHAGRRGREVRVRPDRARRPLDERPGGTAAADGRHRAMGRRPVPVARRRPHRRRAGLPTGRDRHDLPVPGHRGDRRQPRDRRLRLR